NNYAKLFDCFSIQSEHGGIDVVGLRFVDVNTVQRDVGLVRTRSRDVAGAGDARLQRQKRNRIARFEWELSDLLLYKVVSARSILSINQDLACAGRNGYGLAHISHLQRNLQLGRLIHQRIDFSESGLLETFGFNYKLIFARRDERKTESSAV